MTNKPLRLNRDSWNLVRTSGGDVNASQLGLRGAEAAAAAEPENVDFLNTLGTAQYRNGRYDDAHTTLTRYEELRRQSEGKNVPRALAVLAMALFKLGRIDDARAAFERLADVTNDPEEVWLQSQEAMALFKECGQLLESSNGQSEHPEAKKVEE